MRMLPFLRRLHHPLMLILSIFTPALVLLGPAAAPLGHLLLIYPLACVLLCALCLRAPGRLRLPASAASCALLLALGVLLPASQPRPALLALPLLSAAALLAALPLAGRSIHETSPVFYVVGTVSHVASLMLFSYFRDRDVIYDMLNVPLTAFFLVYMLLLLLALNRISLDNATLSRHRLPEGIRRMGTLLTLLFLLIAVLLSLIPALVRGLSALWHGMLRAVIALGSWIVSLLPEGELGEAGAMPLQSIQGEPPAFTEPSLFTLIMEKIAAVLATVVLIVGALILLQLMLRGVRRLIRFLRARMHRFAEAVSEDYEDEITDTREEGEREGGLLLHLRRRPADARPNTPQEHIRLRYARLLRRHSTWSESSTARENLPPDAAALYEKARYSQHALSQEDAQRFLEDTKRL